MHTDLIPSFSFSHDGRHMVSGSYDRTICVWDAETGAIISGPFQGHTSSVLSIALSLDGTRVVSGSADNTVCIWDVATGTIVTEPFEGHTSEVSFVAFFPGNNHIFSFSTSYSTSMVYIWDIESGASVSWEPASAYSVALSLDGKHVVFGSYDNGVHIADAETGTIISGPFQGHIDTVCSVAISPDGRLVVSASRDNTICIWDAETGEVVFGPLLGHTDSVVSVAFSQDGKRAMSFFMTR